MQEEVIVCDLGLVPYEPAWRLQKLIQAELVRAKRDDPPRRLPHVMLLVEHPPVYTLGKSGDASHLLISETMLQQRGASFYRIDRGGDITFHGPGQLVGYPMLDLDRLSPDIHRYLRNLEEVVIATCESFGLHAGRVEGKTGVWIESSASESERKICAMGIRCSRWVTMHGFALNVHTDLDFFSHIVPCGIQNRGVTSLSAEAGESVRIPEVAAILLQEFARVFEVQTTNLSGETALEFIEGFVTEETPDSKSLPDLLLAGNLTGG